MMKKFLFYFLILSCFSSCKDKPDPTPAPTGSTLSNGLVGYYSFSGNVNDQGSLGHNGAIYNSTLTTDRFGNASKSYEFNGTSSYVDLGNINNDVFAGAGKKFTFSVWIKPNSNMSNNIIIGKSADGGCSENERQFYFRILNNKVNFTYSPGSLVTGGRYVSGGTDITNVNKWYHVVMMYDGSVNSGDGLDRVKIFVDNVEETVSFAPGPGGALGTLGDIQIGAAHLGIGNYLTTTGVPCQTATTFNGKIDDVRIYNRALTLSEISEIYNATN
jgi:hypothetical protein